MCTDALSNDRHRAEGSVHLSETVLRLIVGFDSPPHPLRAAMAYEDKIPVKVIFEGGPADGYEYEYMAPESDQIEPLEGVMYSHPHTLDDEDTFVCVTGTPNQWCDVYELDLHTHKDEAFEYPFYRHIGKYHVPRKETA